jgi:hypothetical protein
MTLYPRTISYEPPQTEAAKLFRLPLWRFTLERDPSDRTVFAFTMLIVLGLFLLLQNPYWVPAGDSELYTAVARSLARGQGYQFNGQPVAMIPPGWAVLMAGVMKITPYFLPLKLLAMVCMAGSLACGYWIIRRFAPPKQAALAIILTALLSHVYQATYWLISEGSFCLAVSAGVLLAMQISEGKKSWWRPVTVIALCFAAIMIRWAGLFSVLLVVAALLDKQWKPKFNVQWVTAGLAVLVTLITFIGLRQALKPTAEQLAMAKDTMTGSAEDTGVMLEEPPVTGTASQSAKAYRLIQQGSFTDRFTNWGRWYSWLFWQPFRAAGSSKILGTFATLTGWVVLGLLTITTAVAAAQKRWLWIAVSVYCGALALGWTNVNARYYVPVAFLLMIGVMLAADQLMMWLRNHPARKWVRGGLVAFIASVALCNGLLYAVEVRVARSSRFAQEYETGLNMTLISAGEYLMSLPDARKNGQVAVSGRYTNLNRSRPSPFSLRVMALLTDRVIATPRYKITDVSPVSNVKNGKLVRNWMRLTGVKWYLYQPPISPWRVWHFRLGWYEKWQTGATAEKDEARWRLYRVDPDDDRLVEVQVPQVEKYPTRVPGL